MEFHGQLNANKIFTALFNQIISQQVFADNIKGTNSSLVDMARVDGTLYGDTKLYYSTDALQSYAWGADAEATNLLALDRPKAPECQKIELDVFRQIRLTVDNYLTKQAWMSDSSFSSFNDVMKGWIQDTKKIYDATTYNCYVGTTETAVGDQTKVITVAGDQNPALVMAEALANLLVELQDVSRDFNDYRHIRSYDESDMICVWNAKHYNALKKVDMPVIFHKEGLLNEFEQKVLPARYFGTLMGQTHTEDTVPNNGETYRAVKELTLTVDGEPKHFFAGDAIPAGTAIFRDEVYMEDDTIAFKLIHKGSIPYMSAFQVGTSFFNPRSLTENNYLTFGHNTLQYLKNYPLITARLIDADA